MVSAKNITSEEVNTVRISYDVCIKLRDRVVLYEYQPIFEIKEHYFEKKSKHQFLNNSRHIVISTAPYMTFTESDKNHVIKELCKRNYFVKYIPFVK